MNQHKFVEAKYIFIGLFSVQAIIALVLTALYAYMSFSPEQSSQELGLSNELFIFVILSTFLFPPLALTALLNLFGLPAYILIKKKRPGLSVLFIVFSLLLSVVIVSYAAYRL